MSYQEEITNNTSTSFGRIVNPKERFKHHEFGKEIMKEIAVYLEGNNYNGIFELIEDWMVVFVSIYCTLSLFKISIIIGVISYFIVLIIIGGRQRAIADVLHQSSHGAAATNPYLNFILGTLFSGYTVFQSFSIYTRSHVKLHHPFLGNPHKDPDYQGHIQNNICGINRSSVTIKKYILSIISIKSSYSYIKYLIKNRIYDKNENSLESVMRILYWCCMMCIILFNQCFILFIIFWIIPLITTNVWIGTLLELMEHFPMIDDENIPFIDIFISKNRIWSSYVNFILGVHNEGYHLVHHIFPKLPSWHYKNVHKILMKDKIYSNLDHSEDGCLKMIQRIITDSDSDRFKNKEENNQYNKSCLDYFRAFNFGLLNRMK